MDKRYKMTAGFIVVAVCLGIGGATLKNKKEDTVFVEEKTVTKETFDEGEREELVAEILIATPSPTPFTKEDEDVMIVVHVCGNVKEPGVYTLPSGSRIYEAIELSGGLTENADDSVINQADRCIDRMQIFVPSIGDEIEKPQKDYIKVPDNDAPDAASSSDTGLVNINTAGVEELMTLKGIGQSRAEDIIAYRDENGPFGSVEEIMNIRGIKEGMFSKIRDDITVR